ALVTTLAQGYVWFAHPLRLGVYVEAGPSSGGGHLRTIFTNDPAAGSDITVQSVPAGAIWRVHTLGVQLVKGLTQTQLPALRIRDGSANILAQIPAMTTALGASTTAQLTWGRGLVQESFVAVAGDEQYTAPIPNMDLVAGDDIGVTTDGIGANTNYGFGS